MGGQHSQENQYSQINYLKVFKSNLFVKKKFIHGIILQNQEIC